MKLSEHVNKLRELIEAAFDKQFARLGIGKNNKFDIDRLPDEVKAKRSHFDEMLASHIDETGDYEHAREKLIDELSFTLFNRLAAIKVMEAESLFPPILTKQPEHGDRSFGHKAWLEMNPHMQSEELEGIRDYLKDTFNDLGEALPLYNKNYPYALLPDAISLNEIIDAFNEVEKDAQVGIDIWQSDDILGWLYESYNNEKKQAHKDSKDKTEYNKVSLQSQVYTPRWVVKFLVDNSLGKPYLEMYPDSKIIQKYKIANAPEKQERKPRPLHEIKIIDPACGSGNFLLYAFDFFYDLYMDQIENYGAEYKEEEIDKLIIENNLHGIDLDDRAVQLAQLGLFIKAKKKQNNIDNIFFQVVSSGFYLPEYSVVEHIFVYGGTLSQYQQELIKDIWSDLQFAYKFGSLIRLNEKVTARLKDLEAKQGLGQLEMFTTQDIEEYINFIDEFFVKLKTAVELYAQDQGHTFLSTKTRDAITYLELLTTEYDVAATNPPYTDSSDYGPELKEFINNNYKEPYKFHTNLYASFIKRCYDFVSDAGFIAVVHPPTFMYIKTFEDVRKFIINETHINLFVEWGYLGMFNPSARVDSALYILEKSNKKEKDSVFIKLNNLYETKRYDALFEAYENLIAGREHELLYIISQDKLKIIKSWPFIYWISDEFRRKFELNTIGQSVSVQRGCESGNNSRFLRFWWEVFSQKIDNTRGYYTYAKGGPYQRWFGNLWLIIDFGPESKSIIQKEGNLTSNEFYYSEGITSVRSGTKGPSYRYLPKNCVFDNGATSIFGGKYDNYKYTLSYLNSSLANYIIDCLNPTVNAQIFDIKRMPFVVPDKCTEHQLSSLVSTSIDIKRYLTKFSIIETSFMTSPLNINTNTDIKKRIKKYSNVENYLLTQIIINEAIINEKMFEIYDLTENDKVMVLAKEGESIGGLPVMSEARDAYLADAEATTEFPLDAIQDFIISLPTKEFTDIEREVIESGFHSLYQSNNNLEEFCIRHQVNPINVWYWFKQSNVIPEQRMHTLAMEFLVGMVREILMEDEDGIIPLVPNAGKKVLVDLIEEKFYEKGFSSAQFSSFDSVIGSPLYEYLNKNFFRELSDHLNLFMYLPKTPFIWHLTSGPEQGFDCYIIIYKWSRDKLMRLRSIYIEHRERSLVNRQSDLAGNESAEAQNEKERISRQLKEIESFKSSIDELLSEGYDPVLDDGVGKNIAPLQKKKILSYDVLSESQLTRYLNADW